jgi:1D-myo-inositol-tetrakisphosphate 5-kinase/inositol-polyphosphate multikinase
MDKYVTCGIVFGISALVITALIRKSKVITNFDHSSENITDVELVAAVEFPHQVAGHFNEKLLCANNKILKPKNKEKLFLREKTIYEKMTKELCHHIISLKQFAPQYFGCVHSKDNRILQNSVTGNIRGLSQEKVNSYMLLNDETYQMTLPCVCDIKIGRQTYEPSASLTKKSREIKKYRFQKDIGFRITGFKVYNVVTKQYIMKDKFYGRSLLPNQIQSGLLSFFNNGIELRRDVLIQTIEKLENIYNWMSRQKKYHFYCSSILIIYDAYDPHTKLVRDRKISISRSDSLNSLNQKNQIQHANIQLFDSKKSKISVKLIDFAHTLPCPDDSLDTGYLYGLQKLLSYLYEIIRQHDKEILYT